MRRFQRLQRVLLRAELLSDVPVVVRFGDRFHDGGVVQLLRLVEFVAAGVAGGVEVTDVVDVVAEGAGDVALYRYL